jgi:hypothetical protein
MNINLNKKYRNGEWWDIKRWTGCSETIGDNNIASTRRAIVRAAAEIGKEVK